MALILFLSSRGHHSYPWRSVLQDVGLQLLHEHQVVEDDDGVVLAVSDQDTLKSLDDGDQTKSEEMSRAIILSNLKFLI